MEKKELPELTEEPIHTYIWYMHKAVRNPSLNILVEYNAIFFIFAKQFKSAQTF
jgi:hypothetical protein